MMRWFAAALPLFVAGPRLAGAELEPVRPGPFAVACTNLEVTPCDSGPMFAYLNGKATPQGTQYVTDILVHPAAVPTLAVDVPADPKLFGAQAGQHIPLVLLIVYPTPAENPRPDYSFPYKETGDRLFPHMQGSGEKPMFADPAAKYPLIVFSGGYNTHGLWHLNHLKALAAHGYIVVDMFHGDGRAESLTSSLALRSLELRATVDYLLRHPDFSPAIDAGRIGAHGESAGGHTVLAALGGVDPAGALPVGTDSRIKAGFGVVPFMGGSFGFWPFRLDLWCFGRDHAGLRNVHRPFFALYGEKDSNVPPEGVEAGVREIAGPAAGVMLDGQTHLLSDAANSDVRTWEVLFFAAWLRDDSAARQKIAGGTSVRGGVADHKTIQHDAAPGNR